MSDVSYTFRHELVKHAMADVARSHGITVTLEPTFYTYADGARRPDITFHVPGAAVATDVTIVAPKGKVGEAATRAAADKTTVHHGPVNAMGHKFIPAACESHGFIGEGVYHLAKTLARAIPTYLTKWFYSSFISAVSYALAKGRSATFNHVHQRLQTSIVGRRSLNVSVQNLDYRNKRNTREKVSRNAQNGSDAVVVTPPPVPTSFLMRSSLLASSASAAEVPVSSQ
jgi:hypothetical protein